MTKDLNITLNIVKKYNNLLNKIEYLEKTKLCEFEKNIINDIIKFYNLTNSDIENLSETEISGSDSKNIYIMLMRKFRRLIKNIKGGKAQEQIIGNQLGSPFFIVHPHIDGTAIPITNHIVAAQTYLYISTIP